MFSVTSGLPDWVGLTITLNIKCRHHHWMWSWFLSLLFRPFSFMDRSQFQVVVDNATVSSILSREVIHALDWRLSIWTKTSNEIQITTFPTLCGPSPPNVIWVDVDDEDYIEGDDNEADCDNGIGAEMACSLARGTLGPMNITQWHSTGQSTRQHSDLIKWTVFKTVVENFKLIKKWEERVVLCFF